jgi:hypothetical protein
VFAVGVLFMWEWECCSLCLKSLFDLQGYFSLNSTNQGYLQLCFDQSAPYVLLERIDEISPLSTALPDEE